MPQPLLCAAPWVESVGSYLQELGVCECADSAFRVKPTHQQMQLEKQGSVSLGTG